MKNYTMFSLPIALACLIGACGIGFLSLAIIVANSLVPGLVLPYSYYQALNFPVLSVLLPVVGMSMLMPVALYLAFKREAPAAAEKADAENQATVTAEELEERFLKAA
jgi:hypothetical protein